MKYLFVILMTLGFKSSPAQATDSAKLLLLNQEIDTKVVSKNVDALEHLYANDFVFSHGSGRVEGKKSWMQTVKRANYLLRQHDSVTVELHGKIAVVNGKMNIEKQNKEKVDHYWLKYVRVYQRKKHWQLISHTTVEEKHL